jgi:hypothetical protein
MIAASNITDFNTGDFLKVLIKKETVALIAVMSNEYRLTNIN